MLLKVVEAKRLLESERAESVQEATELVGISRSSFYKYKDDIFPFHDNAKGKTITMVIQMDDEPGLLSVVLGIVAVDYEASSIKKSLDSLIRNMFLSVAVGTVFAALAAFAAAVRMRRNFNKVND